ncbi:MAG: VWA domain-containing protein, partial [Bryobacter sp.]|nr:VWA domain-containing protein [Bryobacter sp.]
MRRAILSLMLVLTLAAQQPADMPVFRASANLVVVTVFVRDKNGQPVANLSKNDFTVLENGKPQTVSVFSFEKLDQPETVSAGAIAAEPVAPAAPAAASAAPVRYRDKRLIVLYFDWTSLPPADQVRAKESAEEFVNKQMGPNDVVALVSFASTLKIDQDFTADREALLSVIKRYQSGVMSELSNEGDLEDADTSEDAAFTADDTEFNIFNTDRKLSALEDMARRLAALPEKKALVYFSSGVDRTGTENESQLRSTINAAVRANVSFYPVDVRGLTADAPGGNASARGGRGTGLFSGQTQTRQRTQAMQRQETLTALAADTGGKALIDENDLAAGIRQVQQDLQSYYVLGYYSSDDRRDGQYRRIDVKLNPNVQAKLDFRKGYFAE